VIERCIKVHLKFIPPLTEARIVVCNRWEVMNKVVRRGKSNGGGEIGRKGKGGNIHLINSTLNNKTELANPYMLAIKCQWRKMVIMIPGR